MAKRGRPKGVDSATTRCRIVDAARAEFATHGYAGASVATIAANADLAPSAVYHYFGGKAALYEAVFELTIDTIWSDVGAAGSHDTLAENVEALVAQTRKLSGTRSDFTDFLALVPMETRLHPEFAHLMAHRSKRQDEFFAALAEVGLASGELDGFDLVGATEMLRALMMGWFLECHFREREVPGSGDALITLANLLGERSLVRS